MGQQQLLLLVLGIVIVGLAVVAGINAFSENQQKSETDAIVNEGMRIATDVQAMALKPSELGGGLTDANDSAKDLATLFPNNDNIDTNTYTTPYGTIEYSHSGGSAQLTLTPNSTGTAISDKVCVFGTANTKGPQLGGTCASA